MRPCTGLTCPFPDPAAHKRGDRWTCPQCGTTYRRSRSIERRWWRNWQAPSGEWRRRFGTWRLDQALSDRGSRWRSPALGRELGLAQHREIGVGASPSEVVEAFGQWALAQGVVSRLDGKRATVLLRAFVAGYQHAMAINAAELDMVKKAGYDVFRGRDARG